MRDAGRWSCLRFVTARATVVLEAGAGQRRLLFEELERPVRGRIVLAKAEASLTMCPAESKGLQPEPETIGQARQGP